MSDTQDRMENLRRRNIKEWERQEADMVKGTIRWLILLEKKDQLLEKKNHLPTDLE